MKLLDRAIEHTPSELILLAPANEQVPSCFGRTRLNFDEHRDRLRELQRFRGQIYHDDGAIPSSLLQSDGRHEQPLDRESWHLLTVDHNGGVSGCARYRHYENPPSHFQELSIRNAAIAKCRHSGWKLRGAVESELQQARERGLAFAEVGGWAIGGQRRCTSDALRIALSTFALAQLLGGCLGVTTATVRHRSSAILRRIGGRSLAADGEEFAAYFDPQYQCYMEMLRFDSNQPPEEFRTLVNRLRSHLSRATVVACPATPTLQYTRGVRPLPLFESIAWQPMVQIG